MEIKLLSKDKQSSVRIVRDETVVTLLEKDGSSPEHVLVENNCPNELTAQAFFNYLLHYQLALGFSRTV